MTLIYFHRFLILCAILFGMFFSWRLYQLWSQHGETTDLGGAIASAAFVVGLAIYLPTVKGRPRGNGG